MKKFTVITLVVVLVGAVSIGVLAHVWSAGQHDG